MAFPTAITPDEAWPLIKERMRLIKAEAQQFRAASLSGSTGAPNVIAYVGQLADHLDYLAPLIAVNGLQAYVEAQTGNQNIAAEYIAARNAISALPARTGVREWMIDNFPKDASGNLAEKKFDANGRVTLNTFSTADLAQLRTRLDALIATIS